MDQWASRKNEPHHQGRNRQTLLLRTPRPAANPPARFRRRLQLRQTPQNPQRPHPIRVRLQSLDFGAAAIQNQPAPANAGTKHHRKPTIWGSTPMYRTTGKHHEKIILWGFPESAYSAKLRSYFTKRGIPYVERFPVETRFKEEIQPLIGCRCSTHI